MNFYYFLKKKSFRKKNSSNLWNRKNFKLINLKKKNKNKLSYFFKFPVSKLKFYNKIFLLGSNKNIFFNYYNFLKETYNYRFLKKVNYIKSFYIYGDLKKRVLRRIFNIRKYLKVNFLLKNKKKFTFKYFLEFLSTFNFGKLNNNFFFYNTYNFFLLNGISFVSYPIFLQNKYKSYYLLNLLKSSFYNNSYLLLNSYYKSRFKIKLYNNLLNVNLYLINNHFGYFSLLKYSSNNINLKYYYNNYLLLRPYLYNYKFNFIFKSYEALDILYKKSLKLKKLNLWEINKNFGVLPYSFNKNNKFNFNFFFYNLSMKKKMKIKKIIINFFLSFNKKLLLNNNLNKSVLSLYNKKSNNLNFSFYLLRIFNFFFKSSNILRIRDIYKHIFFYFNYIYFFFLKKNFSIKFSYNFFNYIFLDKLRKLFFYF